MNSVPVIAAVDCHVHLYRRHDEGAVFDTALRELSRLEPGGHAVLILAERAENHRFAELKKTVDIPAGYTLVRHTENSVTLSAAQLGKELVIVAGRQIATAERLEVLSWFSDVQVPDGLSLADTAQRVKEGQGVPVLTWAPGKWSGARGRLVSELLGRETCRPLFLCDTSLRPIGWPEPAQFKAARELGLPVFAGTDPLPIPGEESQVGKFGVRIELPSDSAIDGATLKGAFLEEKSVSVLGRRNGPVAWAVRYCRFMLEK